MKLGDTFGRLVVKKLLPGSRSVRYRAVVKCSCGTVKTVERSSLVMGKTKSCGCLKKELDLKHGHCAGGSLSATYISWQSMVQRCTDAAATGFSYYGGRGIKVCLRWRNSFSAFLADMGQRPKGKTLDRKKVNKNYTPSNCRWATQSEQLKNRRPYSYV